MCPHTYDVAFAPRFSPPVASCLAACQPAPTNCFPDVFLFLYQSCRIPNSRAVEWFRVMCTDVSVILELCVEFLKHWYLCQNVYPSKIMNKDILEMPPMYFTWSLGLCNVSALKNTQMKSLPLELLHFSVQKIPASLTWTVTFPLAVSLLGLSRWQSLSAKVCRHTRGPCRGTATA